MDHVPVLVKQHRITASQVAFSPDLMTFAAADDLPDGNCQTALWNIMTGEKRWSVAFNVQNTSLRSLSFIADGKVLCAYIKAELNVIWSGE